VTIAERLRFVLEADVSDAQAGFESIGRAAEKELGKAESKLDKVGAGMTRAGAAMLAAGGLAAAGLVKAAGKASDLNEAVNVTEITFGDAADEVGAFAATAARSLGQSERAAREATGGFGGLLQNLGLTNREAAATSIELTKLSSDLGSAFNTEPADAVRALQSALMGQSEPMRRYNVMLTDASVRQKAVEMGLAATTGAVDQNAKAQATLATIMQQTSRYQGDFANTSDGLANSQRILSAQWEDTQAKLGQAVLPVLERATATVSGLLDGFLSLDAATGGMTGTLATYGTGLLLATGAVTLLTGKMIALRASFSAARVAASGFGVVLAAGLAYGMSRVAAHAAQIQQLNSSMQSAAESGGDLTDVMREQVNVGGQFATMIERTGVKFRDLQAGIAGTDDEYDALRSRVVDLTNAWLDGLPTHQSTNALFRDNAIDNATEQLDRNRDAWLRAQSAIETTGEATGRTAGFFDRVLSPGNILRAGDLAQRLHDVATGAGDAEEEVSALQTAYDELLGALDREDVLDRLEDAFDNVQSAAFEAFAAAQSGSADAATKQREYEQTVRASVREIIKSYNDLPSERVTEIRAMLDRGAYDEAWRMIQQLTAERNLFIRAQVTGVVGAGGVYDRTSLSNNQSPPTGRRASGGWAMAGQSYLVGEKGPEVFVPSTSGNVIPNGATATGSPTYITVNMPPGSDGDDVLRALQRLKRRQGPGPLRELVGA
jgi:hypothetical protein